MSSPSSSPSSSSSSSSSSKSPVRIVSTGIVCRYVDSYCRPQGAKVVDMGYSDFELQIYDTVFETHRHQLVKFGSFAGRIRRGREGGGDNLWWLRLDGDKQDVKDMVNTFKILYASVISGPLEFEPSVLISAFRVAKTYDYPELCTYCIEHLEEREDDLTPMQRIEFARAFDPNSREVATYDAMCKRDKPFTEAETRILGMLAWSMVTRIRRLEKAQSEPESATEDGVFILREAIDSRGQGPRPVLSPLFCEEENEEEGESIRERGDDYTKVRNKRDELERLELEERERGYEEALQQHRGRENKQELKLKGGAEESLRSEQEYEWKGKGYEWEEVQEHEWKGQEREQKEHEQDWVVGETSNSPTKGKSNAASRAFSVLSSRYLAVAGRICGNSNPMTDSLQREKGYVSYAKDDSTLFEEYIDNLKCGDDSDFDEKKPLI